MSGLWCNLSEGLDACVRTPQFRTAGYTNPAVCMGRCSQPDVAVFGRPDEDMTKTRDLVPKTSKRVYM